MQGQIIYISKNSQSINQSIECENSFRKHGWNVFRKEGVTPETLNEEDFPYKDTDGGRFEDFRKLDYKKYLTKKSCLFNHLNFCKKVIDKNEPMIFLEHDAICIKDYSDYDFDEYLFLSMEYAFQEPSVLQSLNYKINKSTGVKNFPSDYPLKYKKNNLYRGSYMTPGTAAYILSPKGANKILSAAKKHGLEQSDFIINSHNIRLQYVYPSPVKYNKINLRTSHGE